MTNENKSLALDCLDFKIYQAIIAAHDLKEHAIARKLFEVLDDVRELKKEGA